ncbi:MAG: magnesium transporter CorA family protein [Alphaproteobacteria bacterium]|nr:magnesium transporter CorA family protein [Alphaproteobacteria bacterium]
MIRQFEFRDGKLTVGVSDRDVDPAAVWIDVDSPSSSEENAVSAALGIELPSQEDMLEIEVSSRLYHEAEADFMTVLLPTQTESLEPNTAPITFILTNERLVTVRYHQPQAFGTFAQRAAKSAPDCADGVGVFVALLEAVVDRLADVLERAGQDVEVISTKVFSHKSKKPTKGREFEAVLSEIGRKGDLVSNIRASLMTLDRMTVFATQAAHKRTRSRDIHERVKMANRDVRSLADQAGFVTQKITFLLDATLGMINIEQNAIIKIFSVAAVVFLPPTLVASLYGMNFRHMPELDWPFGYPIAIGMMIASAILPFLYFKGKGWL